MCRPSLGFGGKPLKRTVLTIAGAAGAIAAVAILVAMVTGTAGLVTTAGSSMRPGISDGDLVVVIREPSYEPGDAVAYRSKELGRVVLHRIVSAEDGRFVLRGDANSWDDTDRPAASEILGRRWVTIPRGGRVLAAARSPWVLGSLVVLIGAASAGGMRRGRQRRVAVPASRRLRGDDLPGVRVPWSMRRMIIPVGQIGAESDAVETSNLRDVFRIASGFGLPVLRRAAGHEHVFAVRADSVTYLHRVPVPKAPIAIAEGARRRRTG